MNEFDYKIINFKDVTEGYDVYIQGNIKRIHQNISNEFEPKPLKVQDLQDILGFEINSIIVAFFPYMTRDKLDYKGKSNLSLHAVSKDYHNICRAKMVQLSKDLLINSKMYLQVDSGLFNERFFSIHSGLCMKSISGMSIHQEFGSYGFLGLVATEQHLPSAPIISVKKCCSCMECVKQCPAKAITENGVNGNRCISYLTQKKILTKSESKLVAISKNIYGCDICQQVCPENRNKKISEIADFNQELLYNIKLEEIQSMSNRKFKEMYQDRCFSWRGKKIIERNLRLQNE